MGPLKSSGLWASGTGWIQAVIYREPTELYIGCGVFMASPRRGRHGRASMGFLKGAMSNSIDLYGVSRRAVKTNDIGLRCQRPRNYRGPHPLGKGRGNHQAKAIARRRSMDISRASDWSIALDVITVLLLS